MQQVHTFLSEFKAFALKGNVFDLAIAVVIGTAFGKIVSSLVDSVIMPLIGILLGGVDFTEWTLMIGDVVVAYGALLQAITDFAIIALVIFLAVRFRTRFERKEEAKPTQPSEEVLLLREIRDNTSRR